MMDGTDFLFEENTRVRLKDVAPDYYGGQACVGNEGWIRRNARDKFDLPKVYVEWDTNHWTYNGVPDGWTFQDHFEAVVVEEPKMSSDPQEIARNAAIEFADKIVSMFAQPDTKADPVSVAAAPVEAVTTSDETTPMPEDVRRAIAEAEYREAAKSVIAEMERSEGFVVVGLTREAHPAAPEGVLMPYAYSLGRSEEIEILLKSQVAGYAAQAHTELALRVIASDNPGA